MNFHDLHHYPSEDPMACFYQEKVLDVHHWTDRLFSFKTTRDQGFRFRNGQFAMVGLEIDGRPLMRAYSLASSSFDEALEFFSIKVPDGPLTSRLQHVKVGDEVMVSRKPTGTLVLDNLLPGRNLWLLSTGTGLAPFLSTVRDLGVYERFDRVILVHGVRRVEELAYQSYLTRDLPADEYFGDYVQAQLSYYPTVTREPFRNNGRISTLIESGKMFEDLGAEPLSTVRDRVMLCGSPNMIRDLSGLLEAQGFCEGSSGEPGHYVIEKAFVER